MDFQTAELEMAFDVCFARHYWFTDIVAHVVASFVVITVSCSLPNVWIGVIFVSLCVPLSCLGLLLTGWNESSPRRRNYIMAALWFLAGLHSLLSTPRLVWALASGKPEAMLHAMLLLKWPPLVGMLLLFRLKIGMLPHVYFPSLLMYHYAALRALRLFPPEVVSIAALRSIVDWLNQGVAVVIGLVPGLAHAGPWEWEADRKLLVRISVEQWLAVYCLGIQALLFWGMMWGLWRKERQLRPEFSLSRGLASPVLMKSLGPVLRTAALVHAYIVALLLYLVTYRSYKDSGRFINLEAT